MDIPATVNPSTSPIPSTVNHPPNQPPPQENKKSPKTILITLLVIFLIADLAVLGIYLFLKYSIPNSANINTTAPNISVAKPNAISPANQSEVKVLTIAYIPSLDGVTVDTSVMDNSTGKYSMTVDQTQQNIYTLNYDLSNDLKEGSKYKFHDYPNSIPRVKYTLYDQKTFIDNIPVTDQVIGNKSTKITDYFSILSNVNICDLVDNNDIREVWIWSYTSTDRKVWKSNMSSPYGNISLSDQIPGSLPICQKSYTVYENDYGDGPTKALGSHVHQFEYLFTYLNKDLFWDKYVGFYADITMSGNTIPNHARRCGSTLWPPNASEQGDYSNVGYGDSDCLDWKPDGGKQVPINCAAWGCTEGSYYIFWMQNLPGPGNGLTYKGSKLRNWWDFITDFDNAMKVKKDLVY